MSPHKKGMASYKGTAAQYSKETKKEMKMPNASAMRAGMVSKKKKK